MCFEAKYAIILRRDGLNQDICTSGQNFCMSGQFDIGGITPTRYFFPIAIELGLLFAMISTEQEQAIWITFIQWQLQTVIPVALLIGAHILLLRNARFAGLNPWFTLVLSGLVGGSLFAPVALTIDLWLDSAASKAQIGSELFDEWLSVVPPVTVCWLALNAPWLLGYRLEKTATAGTVSDDKAETWPEPEFMALLPDENRGKLVMLKAELHYLQVVTDRGSTLVLYNLGDAITQLPADLGLSVHRSYWVARDAIERLEKRGRQGELILSDGQAVPVSRNRMAEVTAALTT